MPNPTLRETGSEAFRGFYCLKVRIARIHGSSIRTTLQLKEFELAVFLSSHRV